MFIIRQERVFESEKSIEFSVSSTYIFWCSLSVVLVFAKTKLVFFSNGVYEVCIWRY